MNDMLTSFATRHGVDRGAVFTPGGTFGGTMQAGLLQGELSWYSRGWDGYMNHPQDAETREQAYAMACEWHERGDARHAATGQNRQDQIDGFMDAWASRRPQ